MPGKTILFATDLSCRCDRALDRAAQLAAAWKARLVVVHALQEPAPVTDAPSWRRGLDPRDVVMERLRADLRDADAVDIDLVVQRGEPVALVLDTAERSGCDLVVTGVARDETLGRMLLGTTVDALVRRSTVPVLVVKARARGPYRDIVVATDFSAGSRGALEAALTLFPDASTSLFHAFGVAFEGQIADRMAAREAVREQAMEESRRFLAATPAVQAIGGVLPVICEYGDPAPLLDDLVRVRGVDLVVLGTAGRTGLLGVLVGSVAQRLLGTLSGDVLVVPPRTR